MDNPQPEKPDYEMASIVKELIDVVNQTHVWQRQTRTRLGRSGMPYTAVISQANNPADDKYQTILFPFALEFECMDSAITVSFTWSMQLQIFNKIINIHYWMNNNTADLSSLHDIFAEQDLQTMFAGESHYIRPDKIPISIIKAEADRLSRLLCQFIGYCHRTEMGTLGPQCCRYPKWVLRQFFRQNVGYERELEWVLHAKYITGPGFYDELDLMEFGDNL